MADYFNVDSDEEDDILGVDRQVSMSSVIFLGVLNKFTIQLFFSSW